MELFGNLFKTKTKWEVLKLYSSISVDRQVPIDRKILVDTLRERYMYKTNSDWDELSSSKFPNSTWYRRHRASKSTQSTLETIANTNKFDNLNAIPSIDERKENIREQIAKLRMQKKQSNYW